MSKTRVILALLVVVLGLAAYRAKAQDCDVWCYEVGGVRFCEVVCV